MQELYQWESVAEAGRAALGMRYKLLPHLYTAFHQAHTKGTPVAKPLWFAYPSDPHTHAIDDQWLFGDVLITPILHQVRPCSPLVQKQNLCTRSTESFYAVSNDVWLGWFCMVHAALFITALCLTSLVSLMVSLTPSFLAYYDDAIRQNRLR